VVGASEDVSAIDTSTVETSVSVGVEEGGVSLSLGLGLTLVQVREAGVQGVDQGLVGETIVVNIGGLDNSGDNGLGGHCGDNGGVGVGDAVQVVDSRDGGNNVRLDWGHHGGGVGDGVVGASEDVSAIDTSTVETSVSVSVEEGGVSLSLSLRLGLGVSLTLEEVAAVDMGVSSGVGDNGAGHSLVDKGEGMLDHWCSGNSIDDGGGVDQGLVQVSIGLGSQVLGLGGLDGQGVVRDHSSIGVLHLRVNLGVGITIDTSNQRLGKEDLGVSLGGSLGGSSQSNSNKSFHFWFLFLYFLPS